MNDSNFGGWIFCFLIIAVIFGWGGNGLGAGNATTAAYATMADVNAAINNQTVQNGLNQIALSSANNNYETAQLINAQSMAMANQNNTNLVNAIQGFNNLGLNLSNGFASLNQNIANLGYKMEDCCCSIKTMMLENRLQDAQIALNQQNTQISNAEQTQYLLSVMGNWTPVTAAAVAAK